MVLLVYATDIDRPADILRPSGLWDIAAVAVHNLS